MAKKTTKFTKNSIVNTVRNIEVLREHLSHKSANVSLEDRNRLDAIDEAFSYLVEKAGKAVTTPPHIEKVFAAFQEFQSRGTRIHRSSPGEWQKLMDESQAALKTELAELGLADLIDWTKPEE